VDDPLARTAGVVGQRVEDELQRGERLSGRMARLHLGVGISVWYTRSCGPSIRRVPAGVIRATSAPR
jgi:hypothetical protein